MGKGMETFIEREKSKFCKLFRILYDILEHGRGEASNWMFPTRVMFRFVERAVWDLIKWIYAGTGLEGLLKYSGVWESHQKRFS